MGHMSKEELLGAVLPQKDVEIKGLGTVLVRALSRAQFLRIKESQGDMEAEIMAACLVEPELTVDEAKQLRDSTLPEVLEDFITELMRFSGLLKESQKNAAKSVSQ